jgi:transposase, IS30 family
MARRGRKRRLELEAAYWRLLADWVAASRRVGNSGSGKTGYRWRAENGGLQRGRLTGLAAYEWVSSSFLAS